MYSDSSFLGRRQLLKGSVVGALGMAGCPPSPSWVRSTEATFAQAPTSLSGRRLFVDDAEIERRSGFERVVNPVAKSGANPLVVADRPWEAGCLIIDNAVAFDEAECTFKMWCLVPAFAIGGKVRRTSYLISLDGLHWKRPELGLVRCGGTRRNNVLAVNVSNVVYDPGGPGAAGAFKGNGWSPGTGQYAAFSQDGVHWAQTNQFHLPGAGDVFTPSRSAPVQVLRPAEATSESAAKWRPPLGHHAPEEARPRYIGFVRLYGRVGKFGRRILAVTTSGDFLHWTRPTIVLKPDDEDDQLARQRLARARRVLTYYHPADVRCEFYSMVAFRYEQLYLGLMFVLDVSFDRRRVGKANQDGTRHVELVYSRDLRNWRRLPGRVPLIPLGAPGQWDGAMIGFAAAPIVVGEQIRIYYSGQRLSHGADWRQEVKRFRAGKVRPMSSIGLATLRRDGWVSLVAGRQPAWLLTRPFKLPGGSLHLNVDAADGLLRVTMVDRTGSAVARSHPITGDHTRVPVAFESRLPPAGSTVRLRIEARRAKLFSYWFETVHS